MARRRDGAAGWHGGTARRRDGTATRRSDSTQQHGAPARRKPCAHPLHTLFAAFAFFARARSGAAPTVAAPT
eukprot:4090990-Prymnesium_polylepis.1